MVRIPGHRLDQLSTGIPIGLADESVGLLEIADVIVVLLTRLRTRIAQAAETELRVTVFREEEVGAVTRRAI